jgi:general nucleoside transport system permease protein
LKREKRVLQFIVNWLAGTPSFAAPYALAALGLIIGERAGVLSLGAEGFMLVGALAGVAADLELGGYPAVSLAVAMLAAAGVSLLFALLVVVLRVNQVIAGLAIVFFCQGLTSLVGTLAGWTNRAIGGLHEVAIWPLSDIPIVGRILFTQNLVVYLTIPIFFAVNNILSRSMLGLRLRSVGENPEAADAVGVSVPAYRLGAVVAGSALIGLAGGYLSVVDVKIWIPDMTGGRGWIAIALVIFARWQPWRALFGALLFGCIEALIPRIAAAGIQLPQYFLLMTPYLATIAVMIWAGLSKFGRSNEPAALGQPHVREERR